MDTSMPPPPVPPPSVNIPMSDKYPARKCKLLEIWKDLRSVLIFMVTVFEKHLNGSIVQQ